jgi:predicted nucleic acid-binding protein
VDSVLVDTDVYSYLAQADDPRGHPYRGHIDGKTIVISLITAGELLFGAARRDWGERRVEDLLSRVRATEILPFDFPVSMVYAGVKARLREQGRMIGDNDIWIAAFALRHSIALVSNNRRHFENIPGLILITEAP